MTTDERAKAEALKLICSLDPFKDSMQKWIDKVAAVLLAERLSAERAAYAAAADIVGIYRSRADSGRLQDLESDIRALATPPAQGEE